MADTPITTKKIDWTKIFTFIKSRIFTIILIIALLIFSAIQCSRLNTLKLKAQVANINIIALQDSIHIEKTKNGELLASKAIFVSTISDLKTLNKSLYDKVQAQAGSVISLNNAVIRLTQDSALLAKYLDAKDKIIARLVQIDSNTFMAAWTLPFKYDSLNFDIISGKTYIGVVSKDPLELAHINTELINRVSQIDLTFGERVLKGKYQVYVESAYPGFTVKSLDGFLTDPNSNKYIKSLMTKQHWFTGFSVGVGVTPGYNITTGKFGMTLGPTMTWNVYTF